MDTAVEKARRGGGTRGMTGTKLPVSAPAVTPPEVGSKAWHAGKRSALQQQRAAATTTAAASKARHYPALRHGGFTCQNCRHNDWHAHPVMTKEGAHHPTLVMQGCARCGTMHPANAGVLHKRQPGEVDVAKDVENDVVSDVQKDVDSTETALQSQDVEHSVTDLVGHRSNCPRGGSAPCGKEVKGECTKCGSMVRDHEALGKRGLNATVLDLRKIAADL